MEKSKKKLLEADEVMYTYKELLFDIQESSSRGDEARDEDKAKRERQSKLIVAQMLIDMANMYNDSAHRDDDKLRNAIDVKVSNDVLLAGYVFYVSQNPQFDYTWNNLRKRESKYKEFLFEGIRFLNNMLVDINLFAGIARGERRDLHMEINGLFDVTTIAESPYVRCNVLWDNFHRLAAVKKEYDFMVKCKDSILVIGKRKERKDTEQLLDVALRMLENKERIKK